MVLSLQQEDVDIGLVIDLYKSLMSFISFSRESFAIYEALTQKTKRWLVFRTTLQAKGVLERESEDDEEVLFGGKENFKINVFLTIVDRLTSELDSKKYANDRVFEISYILFKFRELSFEEIKNKTLKLYKIYSKLFQMI